jgi:chemotaxis-related protein WspD
MSLSKIEPTLSRCWRQIGVFGGDRSCAELKQHAHCRNCQVYQRAALDFYSRDSELTSFDDLSDAQSRADFSALMIEINAQVYAVDCKILSEVVEDQKAKRIPHRNAQQIEGLIAVRGELHLCANLRSALGLGRIDSEEHLQPRLLILRDGLMHSIAVRVDRVFGVEFFAMRDCAPPPSVLDEAIRPLCAGVLSWQQRRALVLKGPELFERLQALWYA